MRGYKSRGLTGRKKESLFFRQEREKKENQKLAKRSQIGGTSKKKSFEARSNGKGEPAPRNVLGGGKLKTGEAGDVKKGTRISGVSERGRDVTT